MSNPNNSGTFIGRLGADPVIFPNNDGSAKVKLSVYAQNNFKNKDGNTGSVRASFEAYLSPEKVSNGNGVYGLIHEGDFISVAYEIRNNDYKNQKGEMIYDEVKQIVNLMINESKATTESRLAARKAAESAAAATQG